MVFLFFIFLYSSIGKCMKVYLNRIHQNHEMEPILYSSKELAEKTEKSAIDAIVLYLKNMDNTVRLKRSYSREEAFENLDLITECDTYKTDIEPPSKKMKVSFPLEYIGGESERDFNTVLEAVKRDGLQLKYASRRLQNNDLIVLHSIRQNGLALQYASKKQRQFNYYIALQAVRQNGLALQYLYPILRDRFDIVAAAVRQNGLALSFASRRLQNDYEIIEFARLGRKSGYSTIQNWLL